MLRWRLAVKRLADQLFAPVDAAGLAAFRVLFGLLMAGDAVRYLAYGWVRSHYLEPALLLKYVGFGWVGVLPSPLLHAVFGLMVGAGVAVSLGLFYRLACVVFLVAHTYVFLLAAAYYLNHAYLINVLALLMALVPAHAALSLDARRDPALAARTVPAWSVWLLCFLLAVVYLFGGLAKIDADWLAGEPMRHWLEEPAERMPFLAAALRSEATVYVISWGGLAFDLAIVPLLVWRRTRILGVVLAIAFHLANARLFHIGVFPWLMLAATTLFFDPSWPRRLPWIGSRIAATLDAGAPEPEVPSPRKRRVILASLAAFALLELALPLRHHLYPGDVAWTEEGHYFSWRMKLRDREGRIRFRVRAPSLGTEWEVDPRPQLGRRQNNKMACKPDLILGYAHYLRDAYRRELGAVVEVRADAFCSLNFRPRQRFVDPDVDLARERPTLLPYRWIVPMVPAPLPGASGPRAADPLSAGSRPRS
jgi:hypothetical protein